MSIEEGLPANPMDEPVADRVARGVRLLDEMAPAGWRERVDVERLEITSDDRCILGQIYGAFGDGLYRLDIEGHRGAARYGFAALDTTHMYDMYDVDPTDEANVALNDEWRRVLTAGLTP